MTQYLHGTLPVTPLSNRFIGSVHHEGQTSKVVALATTPIGEVIYVSLVGYNNSVMAALAGLWGKHSVGFEPDGEIDWQGLPGMCRFKEDKYHQHATKIPLTKEVNVLAIANQANIEHGLAFPHVMPEPRRGEDIILPERYLLGNEAVIDLTPDPELDLKEIKNAKGEITHYLDQDGMSVLTEEYTPHYRTFLAQLQCLHVLFLQRDELHPEYIEQWADYLWNSGSHEGLIQEMPACGLRAWQISGNVTRWNNLIRDGLRYNLLPWSKREEGIRITKKAYIPPMVASDVEQLQREAMNDALSIFAGSR